MEIRTRRKTVNAFKKRIKFINLENVKNWFESNKTYGGNSSRCKSWGNSCYSIYPYDFLIENLTIQQNVIETAWLNGVKRFLFLGAVVFIQNFLNSQFKRKNY